MFPCHLCTLYNESEDEQLVDKNALFFRMASSAVIEAGLEQVTLCSSSGWV